MYEFGACENCVESDCDENYNYGREQTFTTNTTTKKESNVEFTKKHDVNAKLDVYLKKKKCGANNNNGQLDEEDLNAVVRGVLKNEEAELATFKNLDTPNEAGLVLFLSDQLDSLKLDMDQKALNNELFFSGQLKLVSNEAGDGRCIYLYYIQF